MAEIEALTWEWVRAYPGISFWRAETAKWVYSVSVDDYELCFVASRFPNNPMTDHASTGHRTPNAERILKIQEFLRTKKGLDFRVVVSQTPRPRVPRLTRFQPNASR